MRQGFTLIEILISVMIISIVGFSLLKLYSQNKSYVLYIQKRPLISFNSSLYNFISLDKYHKSKKRAYDLLYNDFKIKNDEVREYLKKIKREIELKEKRVVFEDNIVGVKIVAKEYKIKKNITNSFFRLELN